MRTVTVALLLLIAGCGDEPTSDYRQADNRVLCEPRTCKAFLVKPSAMAVSHVIRVPHLDYMCGRCDEP